MSDKLTCLSHWFPVIDAAGLPVPKTAILKMPPEAFESILASFDGKEAGNSFPFFEDVRRAADAIGYPCFLRTGLTSHKHDWVRNCFVADPDNIPQHIRNLVEFSECADFMGLAWDVWAVREMLPTMPVGVCRRYGGMPICREFRFFVDGGAVRCWHPYWPLQSLTDGDPEFSGPFDYAAFCRLSDDELGELFRIATTAGVALGGAWSVDLLETKRGWYLTDMAVADRSWHWPDCPRRGES